MIVKKVELKDAEIIHIKPIADVHYGSSYCDIEAFQEFLADSDDNTYFIGVGDILDAIVLKDKRYSKSNDATAIDAIINQVVFELYDILKPYASRIIGLSRGNHEQTVVDKCSVDPIDIVCRMLNINYFGYSYLVQLAINQKILTIKGHHGWGGGSRTQGADITKYARDMLNADADIYLYGHVHKLQHDRIDQLVVRRGKLCARSKILCICGSFQKTLSSTTDASYAEVKGLPVTAIGGLVITIKNTRSGFDISASISKKSDIFAI